MSHNLVIVAPKGISAEAWKAFLIDYLRPQRPALAHCYYRAQVFASERGEKLPSLSTLKRRISEAQPAFVIDALRGVRSYRLVVEA
jgi:hypothetical protein